MNPSPLVRATLGGHRRQVYITPTAWPRLGDLRRICAAERKNLPDFCRFWAVAAEGCAPTAIGIKITGTRMVLHPGLSSTALACMFTCHFEGEATPLEIASFVSLGSLEEGPDVVAALKEALE